MSEPDAPTPAGIPDVLGTLSGWRAWGVRRSNSTLEPELLAPLEGSVWPARRAMTARCRQPEHQPPESDCGCGLYAVDTPARMMGVRTQRGIVGCAALWGEVVEGTRGWRASHGYPRLLVADPALGPRMLARLSENYGVAVHLAELPLPVVVDLLGGTLADRAEALRTGAATWTDVAPELLTAHTEVLRRATAPPDAAPDPPAARRRLGSRRRRAAA